MLLPFKSTLSSAEDADTDDDADTDTDADDDADTDATLKSATILRHAGGNKRLRKKKLFKFLFQILMEGKEGKVSASKWI